MEKESSKEVELWNKALNGAMALPFVKVDRESFLRKELAVYCTSGQLSTAITESPVKVLTKAQINKIANGCIKYHLTLVCSASALAGLPGGWAMAASIPADIAQFYGHVFALTQKLLYLYGWSDLSDENGKLNDDTAQILTLFVGIMMGSHAATEAIKNLTKAFAQQVAVRLPKHALTKYAIYNVAKQVAKWIGIKLTKDGFAKGLAKVVPLIGAPISAGVTYWTFKPMANKLKKHLDEQLVLLFRITTKQSKNTNGIRIEKGMSVEVVTSSMSNPLSTNGGQAVADAFMRVYGIDTKKAGILSTVYLDVVKIG